MKATKKPKVIKSYTRILIFILTFVVSFFILMTAVVTKKYNLSVADIARTNIKANKEVIDNRATKDRISKAEKAVPPKYDEIDVKKQSFENIRVFFIKLLGLKDTAGEDKDKLPILKKEGSSVLPENFPENYLATLLKSSKEDIKELQNLILQSVDYAYQIDICDNKKEEDLKKANEIYRNKINSSKFSKEIRDIAIKIGETQIKPYKIYNKEVTEELRKQAAKAISPVVIQKNQIVVKEGEPVTEEQMEILKDLGLVSDSGLEWYIYVSLGVFVMLIQFLQYYYLYKYYKDIFYDTSKIILISLVNILALILARSISIVSPFLIPLAFAPMIITLLLNYKISLLISILNGILISGVVGFNIDITLIIILNSILGATVVRKMQQRNDLLFSALYIGVCNIILTFTTGMLFSNNVIDVLKKTGFTGIATLISGVLTIGFLPFFESTFDIVTIIKLLELSNPNHPLLKKILLEAPGTYHHSVLVANLAEMATEVIGGNAVFARIAAYYHDVGKTKRPYFFKENQRGENPHAKISPSLSTLIITSHVKDGLEMAKEHNLPKVIQDVIVEHHGRTLVKYFYYTVKNSSDNPDEVKEEDFRYPGPIPRSKESGIIMLADSVEAAVRSITDPTEDKIEAMVNNIIKDKLNDGQLNDCDLTLRDLEKIKKSFLKSLSGIYHKRIEYPTDNTLMEKGKENS